MKWYLVFSIIIAYTSFSNAFLRLLGFTTEQRIAKNLKKVDELIQRVPKLKGKRPSASELVYSDLFLIIYYAETEAIRSEAFDLIKVFIRLGVDLSACDFEKKIVLHRIAPYDKHIQLLAFFLEQGADPRAKNCYGETPLMLAEKARNTEAIKLLQDRERVLNEQEHYILVDYRANGCVQDSIVTLSNVGMQ